MPGEGLGPSRSTLADGLSLGLARLVVIPALRLVRPRDCSIARPMVRLVEGEVRPRSNKQSASSLSPTLDDGEMVQSLIWAFWPQGLDVRSYKYG